VKTATRFSRLMYRMAILAACVLAVAGCRGGSSPGADPDHHEDHAGHIIPAHRPKTFPEAVRRLRELNDLIAHFAGKTEPAAAPDDKTLSIALDIANWLPEIAAESDMPEKPWNEVNARSGAIVADYQAIGSGATTESRSNAVNDAGRAISELETLLAAADPSWFAGPEKHGTTP
jgi:hypothetical protein